MSTWVHISAVLDVDTYIEDTNIEEIARKCMENAPKITGSESDADVIVKVLHGYNIYTNCDCEKCQFKNTIVRGSNGSFTCEPEEDFKCPPGEYQSRVVIVVIGDLRDRDASKTSEEWIAFYKYVTGLDWEIRNTSCSIVESYREPEFYYGDKRVEYTKSSMDDINLERR